MVTQRQLRNRIVIGLSSLLLGLLSIIGFVEYQKFRQNRPNDSVAITRLLIERTDKYTLLLANSDGVWSVLSNIEGRYHQDEVDLVEAGLLNPELVITANDKIIAIGAIDSSGERRYVLSDERVGFVPEWLLSLANGGLSALAQADVFPETLRSLANIEPDKLPAWQALLAQQIVPWPDPDAPPTLSEETLNMTYADERTDTLSLIRNEQYAALRIGTSQCAYIIANKDVPAQ